MNAFRLPKSGVECLACGREVLADAVRVDPRFTFYRWKCVVCDFQWNVDPRTKELTWRVRHDSRPDWKARAPWKPVPDGTLLVVGWEAEDA
jgi:transposase-like protein